MLYANTDDGSSALWVLDGNGVVVDNISYSIADRAPILAQINEHFGTTFTGWSDNEIGLRVGDSLPNWNAYEKIVYIEIAKVKIRWSSTIPPEYLFGDVKRDINNNDILILQCYNSDFNEALVVQGEEIKRYFNISETAQQGILTRIQKVYPQVNEIQFNKTNGYSIGDRINLNEYVEIGF